MKEALLGFKKTINHLDGEIINVTRDLAKAGNIEIMDIEEGSADGGGASVL